MTTVLNFTYILPQLRKCQQSKTVPATQVLDKWKQVPLPCGSPHPHPQTCALIPFVLSWVVMAPTAEPGCLILCVSELSLWLDIVHSKRGRYVNINLGSGT